MSNGKTDTPELSPWAELPVWAAVLIVDTAKGLTLPDRWEGWRWSTYESGVILVHASGYVYTVRRGAPWVV